MPLPPDALDALKETSRTFYIPISLLPDGLRDAIASAYLCMRAIDEIEDHPQLDAATKSRELRAISAFLQAQTSVESFDHQALDAIFRRVPIEQPTVTTRLGEWACLAAAAIAPRIWDAAAAMADRMAYWVDANWRIQSEADLDHYTFSVAGAVGLLVCDIGAWMDGFQMHRVHALNFGRGLQAVNILRNRAVDIARGVDFYPPGWSDTEMHAYAARNLDRASAYAGTLPPAPFAYFIQVPLALARATLDALAHGKEKLSREDVLAVLQQMQIATSTG
jgi:farnesyl-diphosphate farnesyltransferase